ncbi:FTR1 family iron permease [Thermanaerothrix sp.]|uniref:FTR1 family iron permease n=1 Tax=Thermanaerothrix sp. TaxID=2972675 RepID=UPI003C7B2C66
MFAAFLLALREGLEAALVIGILLGALEKFQLQSLKRSVWLGVAAAVGGSLVVGWGLNALGMELEGQAEAAFEGVMMLLAAGLLTWMIFWLHRQGAAIRRELEHDVRVETQRRGAWGLFLVAFTAVGREGIELAIFLLAARFAAGALPTWGGALLGLALAAFVGWVIFTTTYRLNLKRFFQLSNVLLLLFAAGLVAHAVHEFNEIGWIPAVVDPLWDIGHLLPESTFIGQVLTALFGYNANPSLTEVIAYLMYVVSIGILVLPKPSWRVART